MAKTERSRWKNLSIIAETRRGFERILKLANVLYSTIKINIFLAFCLLCSSSSSSSFRTLADKYISDFWGENIFGGYFIISMILDILHMAE